MSFMSAVELHLEFHVKESRTPRLKALYNLNTTKQHRKEHTNELIYSPVVIESFQLSRSRQYFVQKAY